MIKTESFQLYKRILSYSFQYPVILISALVCVILGGFAEAGLFWLLKPILDEGFVEKNSLFIQVMPWLVVGAFVCTSVLSFAGSFGMQWISQHVIVFLRLQMYNKMLHLPQEEYDKHSTGYFISKLTFDIAQLMAVSSMTLVSIIKDSAMIIGLIVVMFVSSWKITLLVFLMAPVLFFVLRYVSRRLRELPVVYKGIWASLIIFWKRGFEGRKRLSFLMLMRGWMIAFHR